jgi:RHS repeat-associated protein
MNMNYGDIVTQSFNASVYTSGTVTALKWQSSPDGSNWTDIAPPQTNSTYTPSSLASAYYRCVATIGGVLYYSNAGAVILAPLNPGTISLTQQPAYGTVPNISFTNSTGGMCNSVNRTYTWETSVDGQPWMTAGTGAAYPAGISISGNTYVRRKVTCGGTTVASNTLYISPTYTSVDYENLNYIRIIDVNIPWWLGTWPSVDQLDINSKSVSTTYLDGLGRPIQKVGKSASLYNGVWTDLVQPIVYDAAGRTTQNFLSYPSVDNPGKYKSANVSTQQTSFVLGKFGEPAGAPTFTQTIYDNSPLNRIKTVYAPGASWGGSSIGVNSDYGFNDASEMVHIWTLTYSSSAIPVTTPTATYPTGSLYTTVTTDEKGLQVITYKDLSGNIILKKVQEKNNAASGLTTQHAGWACTYYVYDDFNQLQFTIPPKAVAYLDGSGSWNLTQQLVNDLCFVNSYDAKGRPIAKKQPGAGETDIVYDQQDRPVFMQDANGRNNSQWQGSLYDGLGRTISTGVLPQSITTSNLQTYVNSNSGAANIIASSTSVSTGPTYSSDISVNSRTTGVTLYTATNSITFTPGFTSEAGAQFIAVIATPGIATFNEVVTVPDNPAPSGFITLTQSFYDDYTNATKAYTAVDNSLFDASTDPSAVPLPAQPSPQTRGMATTSKVKVITNYADLTQGSWIETTTYYNDQGNVIQMQSDNAMGGTDRVSSKLDFVGRAWGVAETHRAGTSNQFTIVSRNVFDKQGKLTDLYKNFNNTFSKYLASYSYDEYGKLKNKTLAPGYTGSGKSAMETLNYDYNIQGWLTGINKTYALSTNVYDQWNQFFGFYLGYNNADNQFNAPQYNGAITGVIWKSQGDNSMRRYDYTYDNLGRLTSGVFQQRKAPSDGWSNGAIDLSESITYADQNGNIQTMKHLGAVPGMPAGTVVDNLTYTYGSATNQNVNILTRVDESSPLAVNGQMFDFKDGTNAAGTDDYAYDANGNLTMDQNKGITSGSIIYNYLNKPSKVTIAGKTIIEYTYDATGIKLSKKVTDLTVTPNTYTTTYYSGEFIYQDANLQYILHEEGRLNVITPVASSSLTLNSGAAGANNILAGKQGVFEYFLKDQLGNTRMVLTEEVQKEIYLATIETTDPVVESNEEKLFGKVDPTTGNPTADNEVILTRTNTPNTLWTSNTSAKVTLLTASDATKKVGPNLIMKVSAGDVISASAKYFYFTNDASGTTNPVNDALTSLMGALLGNKASALTKTNSSLIQTNLSSSTGDFANFFTNPNRTGGTTPKAFLNVVFFDEQFNFVPQDAGAPTVGTWFARVSLNNTQNATLLLSQKAPKNGWVYVYLSNESNQSVYFDDLQVSQDHGRISEENHYYAFGQKIAGICTKAFNKLTNPFNYQGDYSEEETYTGWDEFDLRMYDPQIGRWTGVDPYDQFASPYVGMGNDPVNNVDPDGGDADLFTALGSAAVGGIIAYEIARNNTSNAWARAGITAAGALLGAGIGYGVSASLESNTPFSLNFRAFYKGFFGGSGWVNGPPDANDNTTSVFVPNVWGWVNDISLPHIKIKLPKLPKLDPSELGEAFSFDVSFKAGKTDIDYGRTDPKRLDKDIKKAIRILKRNPKQDLSISGGVDSRTDQGDRPDIIALEALARARVQTVINLIRSRTQNQKVLRRIYDNGKTIGPNRVVTADMIK